MTKKVDPPVATPYGDHGWWRTRVAPLSLGQSIVMYVLLVVPAVLGAVLAWPWGVQVALMIPALVLNNRWGRRNAIADDVPPRSVGEDALLGGIAGGFTGFVFISTGLADGEARYFGLVVVVLALLLDPVFRWQYGRSVERAQRKSGIA